MTEQVAKLMKALDLTEEEALELIESDKAVDRMKDSEVNSDLSAEQKKAVKKASSVGTKKPTVYKFDSEKAKNRKKDDEKVELVEKIADFLAGIVENAEIANPGQKISFKIGENSYSLTLTKHRK